MATDQIKVLIVDDEANIRDLLSTTLKFNDFSVYAVANGKETVIDAEKGKPDIILLDIMLPDQSGFAVTKKLRSMGIDIPVLFLSARGEVEDKITGLTIGGDDYLPKPFSPNEVIARINAILRRTRKVAVADSEFTVGEITINEDAHEVFVSGQNVEFSPTEYKLLRFLMANANRVMSKAQILDHVWEYDFGGEMGIVESYVSYLRRKLDPLTVEPVIITKRGVGYMFKSAKKSQPHNS